MQRGSKLHYICPGACNKNKYTAKKSGEACHACCFISFLRILGRSWSSPKNDESFLPKKSGIGSMPQWDSHPRCHRRPGTKPARNVVYVVWLYRFGSLLSIFPPFYHQSYHSIGQKLHCTSQLGHFNTAFGWTGGICFCINSRTLPQAATPAATYGNIVRENTTVFFAMWWSTAVRGTNIKKRISSFKRHHLEMYMMEVPMYQCMLH